MEFFTAAIHCFLPVLQAEVLSCTGGRQENPEDLLQTVNLFPSGRSPGEAGAILLHHLPAFIVVGALHSHPTDRACTSLSAAFGCFRLLHLKGPGEGLCCHL